MAELDLQDANYRSTLHWGIARDGFDSILSVFNYYGDAFRGQPTAHTDADLTVQPFNEEGTPLRPAVLAVATGETIHLRISQLWPGHRGVVAARMTPRGRMARLSAPVSGKTKPIATSFFMLYERVGGFRDFSHELFLARNDVEPRPAEWASVVYPDPLTQAGVVVMNNHLGCDPAEFGSNVEIELLAMDGSALHDRCYFNLMPGGSRVMMLEDAFPGFFQAADTARTIVVRGKNIEQPMTLHLKDGGDFNLHHF